MDVMVMGDAYIDVTLSSGATRIAPGMEVLSPIDVSAGGSAGYAARALAALGRKVEIVATVGRDVFGKLWIGELRRKGVRTAHVRIASEQPTGLSVVVPIEGDRSFITQQGANCTPFTPDGLAEIHPSVLLVAGFLQTPCLWHPAFAKFLVEWRDRHASASLLLDPNLGNGSAAGLAALTSILRTGCVDMLLPNRRELTIIGGVAEPEAAARNIAAAYNVVVVAKLDRDGALLVDRGRSLHLETRPVEAVNANACGDIFAAALCDGLIRAVGIEESTSFAVTAASRAAAALSMEAKFAAVVHVSQEAWAA